MRKYFILLLASGFITGCSGAGETTTRLSAYQYTPVQDVGNNVFWLQGYDSEDALTGARAHCSKLGGTFKMKEMVPHTRKDRATVTFEC